MPFTQDSQATFKPNLTCILLSDRTRYIISNPDGRPCTIQAFFIEKWGKTIFLVKSISNFCINKISHANILSAKKIPSCINSALSVILSSNSKFIWQLETLHVNILYGCCCCCSKLFMTVGLQKDPSLEREASIKQQKAWWKMLVTQLHEYSSIKTIITQ